MKLIELVIVSLFEINMKKEYEACKLKKVICLWRQWFNLMTIDQNKLYSKVMLDQLCLHCTLQDPSIQSQLVINFYVHMSKLKDLKINQLKAKSTFKGHMHDKNKIIIKMKRA